MTEISFEEYSPRTAFIPFHQRENRWSVLVCHRRAGKTVACINDVLARAVYTEKKNARYAYIAPFYRQAKDVAWTYLKEYAGEAAVKVRESQLRIELFNGAWITLYGADNPDALRGLYFDGVILDEIGDMRPSLWGQVVLPTLADRKGWAVFIGTPKGKNHFYQIWTRAKREDNWFDMMLPASRSGILDEEELLEMRAQTSDEEYDQEFECSFEAAVTGTYYAKLVRMAEEAIPPRIRKLPYDPEFEVQASSDLGFTDSTAFWFWQERPDGFAMIDYEEHKGEPLQFYFDMLHYKNYKFSTIWLPHDAKAKTLQTGRSTVEQFLLAKFPVRIAPKLSVQHGIDAARLILPYCVFDAENCFEGIEALRAYRRSFDEVKRIFSNKPMHDWASNGADAFRYFALVSKERIVKPPKELAGLTEAAHYGFTLDDLHKHRDKELRLKRMRVM